MTDGLREHLVYPEALFRTQLQLLRNRDAPRRPGFLGRLQAPRGEESPDGDTFWWLSSGPAGKNARLRRLSTLQADDPPRLAGLVEGVVDETGPVLSDWAAARSWFGRLDAARQSGDWIAFGRAYEELRRLLIGDSIPCRGPGCS